MSYQSRKAFANKDVIFATPASRQPTLKQRLAMQLKIWRARTIARRDLAMMDARSLRDAGISPGPRPMNRARRSGRPSGRCVNRSVIGRKFASESP